MAANDVETARAAYEAAKGEVTETSKHLSGTTIRADYFNLLAVDKRHKAADAYIQSLEARLREVEAERDALAAKVEAAD